MGNVLSIPPFEAKLNIKANELAVQIQKYSAGSANIPSMYRGEGMIIHDKKNRKVKNISQYIAKIIRGAEFEEYICQKYCWDKKTFVTIEWKGHEIYLIKLQLQKIINILQLIHDWQNTGKQKWKFAESKQKKHMKNWSEEQYQIVEEGMRLEASCSFQCGIKTPKLNFLVDIVRLVASFLY